MACALYTVSGTFERKLPLIAKNTLTSPSNIACRLSTVSYPDFWGGSKLNSFPRASRKGLGGRSHTAIVGSPWTLECPRTHTVPAPGRPICPPTSRRFTIIATLSTPLRCWVTPVHQAHLFFFAADTYRAAARVC